MLDPEREIIRDKGFLIDASTGEVLGLVEEEKEPFRITDEKSLHWVLSLLFDAEAEVDAAERRAAALYANACKITLEKQRRLDWLRLRFMTEVEEITRDQLDGSKVRSIKTAYGTLGLRKTQGAIKVIDQEWAVKWCEEDALDAVNVTKEILVSKLKGREGELPATAFSVTEPSEKFFYKSGLEPS